MRDKHKGSHILFVHRPGGAGEVRRPSLGRVGCVGGRADGRPVARPVAGGPCRCVANKNTCRLCKLKVQRQSGKYAR